LQYKLYQMENIQRHSAGAGEISLHTLHVAYEIAENNPDEWRDLLSSLLPADRAAAPDTLVRELANGSDPLHAQLARFQAATGLSRRSLLQLSAAAGYRAARRTACAVRPNADVLTNLRTRSSSHTVAASRAA
jgi:hypothetical protein